MATVITAEPIRAGAVMPRASINGLQFVEAEPIRAGAVLVDPRIGSSREIHSVLGWTPADASEGNEIAGPVTVNFKAENSAVGEVDLATGTAFDDNGTHAGTVSLGTGIQLVTSSPGTNFEDYLNDTDVFAGTQPELWTNASPYSGTFVRDDIAGEPENQYVRAANYNQVLMARYDEAGGSIEAGIVRARFQFDTDGLVALFFNTTGTGAALRGHGLRFGTASSFAGFVRLNSYSSWSVLTSPSLGFTPSPDTWYRLKVHFVKSASTVWCEFKIWEDGGSEPSSYTWGGSDAAYVQAGYCGFGTVHDTTSQIMYIDDFYVEPSPAVYGSSGNWQSDPLDVSVVGALASSRINFDATMPTDTTAVVKCRWGDGDAWLTCTAGASLPGATYRDDMRTGAAKSLLELRIELATTDTSKTPNVDNFVIDFDPCEFADVDLVVDGSSATIANGHLAKWGRRQVSAGVEIEAFDDISIQSWGFESYRLNGEALTAVFEYDGYAVESAIFSQLLQAFRTTAGPNAYFGFLGGGGAKEANALFQWNAWDQWYRGFHDYNWTLIDKTQGIHADAWYYVGHAQIDDFPGSMLVAELVLSDHLGSMLVNGYARDDFPGSMLVQGYRSDDFPGSILPALETMVDFLGSLVVAYVHRTDVPGSLLVFGVNRHNEFDIQTIDADTVAALEAIGFTFPAEAP